MATVSGEMTFLQHLGELRRRFFISVIAIAIGAIPCGIFWRTIFDVFMVHPLRFSNPKPQLIFTAPAEAVVISMKIALFGGLVLALPVVFFQMWRFVAPGLHKNERSTILPAVIASTFFFILGAGFCYIVLPYIIKFLSEFGAGRIQPIFKVDEYFGFILKLILAFGVVFELPVVSFVLTRIGILTPRFLIKNFRYAIVLIFVVSAVLTPPDIISQTALAAPLLVLYAISILVSYLVARKKKKHDS
jgi:sec-independent protein translocase protein TatC